MSGYNLENAQAYCDRQIKSELHSSLYQRCPLAAYMLGLGGEATELGRPGQNSIISGSKIGKTDKKTDGAVPVTRDVRILTAQSGGGRTRSARDTNPAVKQSQDRNVGSARFWWWFHGQPLKVWRSTLRKGTGRYRIANALKEAAMMAKDEALDIVAQKLWTGSPSTYAPSSDEDQYDDLPGVLDAMSSTNSYGNVDRTVADNFVNGRHPWASNRETNARAAALELIDEANDVCQVFGDGVNLVLTTRAIYRKLKKEAQGKGGVIIHNGSIPGYGTVGYKKAAIMYDNTCITFDPFCPAGHVGMFTTSDWELHIHPEENFAVAPFEDNRRPGAEAALTSTLELGLMPMCRKPVNQYLFTNVS